MLKIAIQRLTDFSDYAEAKDWKEMINDKKQGVLISTREGPSKCNSVKATGVLNYTPIEIFRTLTDSKYRSLYDSNYDTSSYLKKIANQAYIVYQRTKKISIVSPREFIYIMVYNKYPDGSIKLVVSSVAKDELVP